MFICQKIQTWILVIIFILFMIGHHEQVLIRIHDIDAFLSQQNLFLPSFSLESKFIHQMRQTWILLRISIIFVIGHHKHIFLTGIHYIYSLASHEKLLFPPFSLELKFIHFVIGHYKNIFLIMVHHIDALISLEKLFFHHFPYNQTSSVK